MVLHNVLSRKVGDIADTTEKPKNMFIHGAKKCADKKEMELVVPSMSKLYELAVTVCPLAIIMPTKTGIHASINVEAPWMTPVSLTIDWTIGVITTIQIHNVPIRFIIPPIFFSPKLIFILPSKAQSIIIPSKDSNAFIGAWTPSPSILRI